MYIFFKSGQEKAFLSLKDVCLCLSTCMLVHMVGVKHLRGCCCLGATVFLNVK